jgi:hypothetical protein
MSIPIIKISLKSQSELNIDLFSVLALNNNRNSNFSNTSLLGVRLPPDTEIIKYTSSGSKMQSNFVIIKHHFITKFLCLFLVHNSYNQSDLDIHISPKRKKVDNYDTIMDKQKNDMVEVIKLPSNMSSNGSMDLKTSNGMILNI